MSDFDKFIVIGKRSNPKIAKTPSQVNGICKIIVLDSICFDSTALKALRSGASAEKKLTAGNNRPLQDHQHIAKIDRENEVAPPPKVSPAVGKAMQDARMAKGLTQKIVAQRVNEKLNLIQDYESGKAIPKPQVLMKLEQLLGVKLRGADIGKEVAKSPAGTAKSRAAAGTTKSPARVA